MMVFEYIIRYSLRRRASPCVAKGFSPMAYALERFIAVLKYVEPCRGLPCRARRPLPLRSRSPRLRVSRSDARKDAEHAEECRVRHSFPVERLTSCENCAMCRNKFRRASLVDRNSFRSPRGGAMFVAVVRRVLNFVQSVQLYENCYKRGRIAVCGRDACAPIRGGRFIPAVQEPAPLVLHQPTGQSSETRQSGRKRRFCPALMRQNRVVSACRRRSGRSAHCEAAENPP